MKAEKEHPVKTDENRRERNIQLKLVFVIEIFEGVVCR